MKGLGLVVALAVMVGLVFPVEALIIDDFDTPAGGQFTCDGPGCGGTPSFSSVSGLAGVLGGERDLLATKVSGPEDVGLRANSGGSGNLSFSSGDGTVGVGQVQWDGADDAATIDTNGLGSADLTVGGNSAFLVRARADLPGGSITFTVYDDSSGTAYAAPAVTLTSGVGFVEYLIPFASFVGAEFTDIGAITLDVTGTANFDGAVDIVAAVPEPGSLFLLGSGLIVGGAWARRRMARD